MKEYFIKKLLKFLWNYTRWLGQIFPQSESGSMLNFSTWHLGKHLQTYPRRLSVSARTGQKPGPGRPSWGESVPGRSHFPSYSQCLLLLSLLASLHSHPPHPRPPWKSELQNEDAHRCQLVIKLDFTPEIYTQLLRVCYIPGRNDAKAETPVLWPPHAKSWLIGKDWCWEGLGAGGNGDDRGWDGWMASPTQRTWVWVNSGRWWWTGRPGVLRFMGSQKVGHDWATELNWTVSFLRLHCTQSTWI